MHARAVAAGRAGAWAWQAGGERAAEQQGIFFLVSARYIFNFLITVLCVLTVSIGMSYLHAVAFVSDIHMHIYIVTNLLD